MNWLRPLTCLLLLAPVSLLHACSSDDSSATSQIDYDASQTPIPKIEAGAPCATNNDCQSGLVCLYPATTCEAFRVCTAAPADPCPAPQNACSCLGEPIQVCNGFASDPIDPTGGSCGEGGIVITPDSGPSEDAGDSAAPPNDSGSDSGFDAGADAADAAG